MFNNKVNSHPDNGVEMGSRLMTITVSVMLTSNAVAVEQSKTNATMTGANNTFAVRIQAIVSAYY
jgi:hypothetical protein